MNLSAYLERIKFTQPVTPDRQTLFALHRAHLTHIPYENFDIHRGQPLSLDEAAIFDKLVTGRRGGWCYEMNGLLAWALRAAGFQVTLLASAVGRATSGDSAERNHLIVRVDLDRPYLADVGFGNGFYEPLALEPGVYDQDGYTFALEQTGDRWQFHNHPRGGIGYDFTLEPRVMSDFAERCHQLQTDPASNFVRTAVAFRFTPTAHYGLRSLTLRTITRRGTDEQVIADESEYRRVLRDRFNLDLPDVDRLWRAAAAQHAAWQTAQLEGSDK